MNSTGPAFLFLMVAVVLTGCYSKSVNQQDQKPSLEGSWNLVAYKPDSEEEWRTYGDSILYQKHLTSDHFGWFKYDVSNNRILGIGGGSYVIKDGKYIENIKFFYPPGSTELGQAIPFSFKLEDDNWYHLGYAKQMEVDMESGKLTAIDSNRIEEKWVRTKLKPNQNDQLTGTWDLISYRDSLNGSYTEYPDFAGYIKLITSTHFMWIYFDMDGDEIYGAGSGEYSFDGQKYSEKIRMIYPNNLGQVGEEIHFNTGIMDNTWNHLGYLPTLTIDETTGKVDRDSSLIDEKWKLHQSDVMDGITF